MRGIYGVIALLAAIGNAEVIISSVAPEEGRFVFIGKFAFGFDPSGATVGTVTFSGLSNTVPVSLYLYDDEPDSWPAIADAGSMSCSDKLDKARQVLTVVSPTATPGRFLVSMDITEKLRPRFWYAVVASGDCDRSMSIPSFRLDFRNGDSPVGVNDEGMNTLYGLFFPLSLGMLAFAAVVSLRNRAFSPPPLRIWQAALGMFTAGMLCLLIHWSLYASDGQGSPGFKGLGMLLQGMARVTMWVVLVLFASGVGITFLALSERSKRENIAALGFTTVFSALYVSLLIWWFTAEDPSSTTFIWDTGFGVTVLVFQTLFAAAWFVVLVRTAAQEGNAEKHRFYLGFGSSYLAWFLSLPVIAIIAALVSPWYRERTALILEVLADFFWIAITGNVVFHPAISASVFDPLSQSSASDRLHDDAPAAERRTGFEDL